MSRVDPLRAEGAVFLRYLCGTDGGDYAVGKYADAHAVMPGCRATTRFDRWLVALARHSPLATRFADAFTRLLRPRSVLLRKLTLALAIAETSPGLHRRVDQPLVGAFPVVAAVTALRMAGAVATVLVAAIVLAPAWLVASLLDLVS